MDNVKVTVILPSLNVGKYIRECLSSVMEQSLSDIEILCIDAGSEDETQEIIKECQSIDGRIRLICSEKKSYGYQVNLGISLARGSYIAIVETDDFVSVDALRQMYELAKKEDADYVKADFSVFISNENGEKVIWPYSLNSCYNIKYGGPFTKADFFGYIQQVDPFIWNAIYKREYLRRFVVFNESPGAAFQDFSVRYQIAASADRAFFTDVMYYYYRRDNPGSSMYSLKGFENNYNECVYLLNRVSHLICSDTRARNYLYERIITTLLISYKESPLVNNVNENELLENMKSIVKMAWNNGYVDRQNLLDSISDDAWLLVTDTEQYKNYLNEKKKDEQERIQDFCSKISSYGKAILFGAGVRGNGAYFFVTRNRLSKIVGICDNNKDKWGMEFCGMRIQEPRLLLGLPEECAVIVTVKNHRDDIREQLSLMGISECQIIDFWGSEDIISSIRTVKKKFG